MRNEEWRFKSLRDLLDSISMPPFLSLLNP